MKYNKIKYMLLNLPSPPGFNIYREYGGNFGTAIKVERDGYGHTGDSQLPIWLVYASSAMIHLDCNFSVLDGQVENSSFIEIIENVEKEKPDILITLVSLPSFEEDINILRSIKAALPKTIIICLGTVCNVLPEDVLSSGCVDVAVRGWYPYYNQISNVIKASHESNNVIDFKKIPGAVYFSKGSIVHNSSEPPLECLDDLSLEAYQKIHIEKYRVEVEMPDGNKKFFIPIITGAGCPYSCMYCPYPLGHGKKHINRSVKNTISEIEYLKNNFGFEVFLLNDPVFGQNKEQIYKLCNKLIELDIQWMTQTRADLITEEILLEMKKAGCYQINIGVETGDNGILTTVGKKGVTIDDFKRVFKAAKKIGLLTHAHIILGLPGETKKTIKNTYNLVKELNPDYLNVNIATPFPGTKLYGLAEEKSWIQSRNWKEYTHFDAVMRVNDLSTNDLNEQRKKFLKKFKIYQLMHDSEFRNEWLKRKIHFF